MLQLKNFSSNNLFDKKLLVFAYVYTKVRINLENDFYVNLSLCDYISSGFFIFFFITNRRYEMYELTSARHIVSIGLEQCWPGPGRRFSEEAVNVLNIPLYSSEDASWRCETCRDEISKIKLDSFSVFLFAPDLLPYSMI